MALIISLRRHFDNVGDAERKASIAVQNSPCRAAWVGLAERPAVATSERPQLANQTQNEKNEKLAEVIIFPGVRYERWDQRQQPVTGSGVANAEITRDWLEI